MSAARTTEEPDARCALADERHVHGLLALPDVGERALVAVDLVEGRVLLDPHARSPREEAARCRRGVVAVALGALLGRVDLDEAHSPAVDELDRVAVRHPGDHGSAVFVFALEVEERRARPRSQARSR